MSATSNRVIPASRAASIDARAPSGVSVTVFGATQVVAPQAGGGDGETREAEPAQYWLSHASQAS